MKHQFTILVPVYNEEECLPQLLEHLSEYQQNASLRTRILMIDDGSSDASARIIKDFCNTNQDFGFLFFEKNFGKGAALKAGFDHTESALVGYLDADLQTHPEDFEKLIPYMTEYDLVSGWRRDRKDSLTKKISSKFGNAVRNFFTNDNMNDTGCPLKILRTDMAKQIPMFKGLQRFLPAMILLQNGRITEVPIPHYPRFAGYSKYSFKNRFMGPLMDCLAYVWMRKSYINYKISENNE